MAQTSCNSFDWSSAVALPIYKYYYFFFFFKQKTAYEIKECDWSSDVCSSDLRKLLSKEIFKQAEKEAKELTKKEVALAIKKGNEKPVSNEISHLLKRQTADFGKIGPEFHINTYTTGEIGRASCRERV